MNFVKIDPKHMSKRDAFISWEMLYSMAFMSLNGTEIKVLLHFLKERTHVQRVYSTGPYPFPIAKALRLGIAKETFRRSLRVLEEKGFIEKVSNGTNLGGKKKPSMYMLIDDWKEYIDPMCS